jgi:hypothetical protein
MSIPIIFAHKDYGCNTNSKYLSHSLEMAKLTNPNSEVILIGDDASRELISSKGIIFVPLQEFDNDKLVNELQSVIKFIGNHHKMPMIRYEFLFSRYLIFYLYASKYNIDKFWHFDSDTFVVRDLSPLVPHFSSYVCNVLNRGTGCNGVLRQDFLESISKFFISMFRDMGNQFYNKLKNIDCIYTEMYGVSRFIRETKPSTVIISEEHQNSIFDPCIWSSDGYIKDPSFRSSDSSKPGRRAKLINVNDNNQLFVKRDDGKNILLNSINFSWCHYSDIKSRYEMYKTILSMIGN